MAGRTVGLWFPGTYRRDYRFFVGSALIGLRGALIGLFFLVNTLPALAAQSTLAPAIALTSEERSWLKAHPGIILGYADSYEPNVIVNPNGSLSGILVDLLMEVNKRLGTRIGLKVFPPKELFEKAKNKEINGILNLHPDYADKLGMLKTKEYIHNYPTVFGHKDITFNTPDDYVGKRVAIVENIHFSNKIIVSVHGATDVLLKSRKDREVYFGNRT